MSLTSIFSLIKGRREPKISNADIARFAEEVVNLKHEAAADYLHQISLLDAQLYLFAIRNPDQGFLHTELHGSLAHGTATKSISKIDIAFYFKPNMSTLTEAELLDHVANCIASACPHIEPSQIEPNEHTVLIEGFISGQNVEVMPVILEAGAQGLGYHFAFGAMPIFTSTALHCQFLQKRKQRHDPHFSQVVRLVKWWVLERTLLDGEFGLGSFAAELIAAHLADHGVKFANYAAALEQFFSYIAKSELAERIAFADYYRPSKVVFAERNPIEILDPVNEMNNIAACYDDFQRMHFVAAAEEALEALGEARSATTREAALECWQSVLGPSFQG